MHSSDAASLLERNIDAYSLSINHMLKYKDLIDWLFPCFSQLRRARWSSPSCPTTCWARYGSWLTSTRTVSPILQFFFSVVRQDLVDYVWKSFGSLWNFGSFTHTFSVAYPDPGFEFFPSRIQGQKDSRIRIRIKEFKYFNPKIVLFS